MAPPLSGEALLLPSVMPGSGITLIHPLVTGEGLRFLQRESAEDSQGQDPEEFQHFKGMQE